MKCKPWGERRGLANDVGWMVDGNAQQKFHFHALEPAHATLTKPCRRRYHAGSKSCTTHIFRQPLPARPIGRNRSTCSDLRYTQPLAITTLQSPAPRSVATFPADFWACFIALLKPLLKHHYAASSAAAARRLELPTAAASVHRRRRQRCRILARAAPDCQWRQYRTSIASHKGSAYYRQYTVRLISREESGPVLCPSGVTHSCW